MARMAWMRGMVLGAVAVLSLAVALPAAAQITSGGVSGKVVDDKGVGIAGATVTFTNTDQGQTVTMTTNDKGQYQRMGMATGHYKIVVKKGPLGFEVPEFQIGMGVSDVPVIKLSASPDTSDAGAVAAAKAAKDAKAGALQKLSDDAQASFDAGNMDDAIEKLSQIVKDAKCATCYHRMADAYVKKNDQTNAELNYKKAIEVDPNLVQSYLALAALDKAMAEQATDPAVKQQRTSDAAAMTAKATEIASSTGGAAGAVALFNQGAALMNDGKGAEAQVFFERAIAADPKNAEAHYLLGLSLVNQGKLDKQASTAFQEYIKLAPNGPNVATAKALLAQIK